MSVCESGKAKLPGLASGWGATFVIFALLLCGLPAVAFVVNEDETGQQRHWQLVNLNPQVSTNVFNPSTRAIRYFLPANAYSTANANNELNALRAAFAQWQAVPGTLLKFEEGGLVGAGVDIQTEDNTNVIFWAKTSTIVNGGNDNILNNLAVTFTSTFLDNTIAETDTVVNGVQSNFTWFTDFNTGPTAAYFVEAFMLHEIGHWLGLDHSPVGGATMMVRGLPGIGPMAGLSGDEIAAALYLYPQASMPAQLSTLKGQVTLGGGGVFGAVVLLENPAGNLVAGTVTRANGTYELPGVAPGNYFARVTPLDPNAASTTAFLLRGFDISPAFGNAQTDFVPTTNRGATLAAGMATTLNFAVAGGPPPFRITRIRPPTSISDLHEVVNAAAKIGPGQSNLFVGVYSPNLPASGGTLTVTGDGLTLGVTTAVPNVFPGLNLMSVSISVASNATPGLRSFVVQRGSDLAYANGFLEILTPVPDYNFDGLDDTFQRKYFPVFIAAEAVPNADPDGDGFTNAREYLAGSSPVDARSLFFKILSVKLTAQGSTVTFETGPGKRYQIYSRRDVAGDPWQAVGAPVTATSNVSQFFDVSATDSMKFYRVQWSQ